MKRMKEKTKQITLSNQAERLFLACLPIIFIALHVLFMSFLTEYEQYPQYAVVVYQPMFEYIMMSLAILAGGGLLFDYVVKSYD